MTCAVREEKKRREEKVNVNIIFVSCMGNEEGTRSARCSGGRAHQFFAKVALSLSALEKERRDGKNCLNVL